jgi:hypothetical protein
LIPAVLQLPLCDKSQSCKKLYKNQSINHLDPRFFLAFIADSDVEKLEPKHMPEARKI